MDHFLSRVLYFPDFLIGSSFAIKDEHNGLLVKNGGMMIYEIKDGKPTEYSRFNDRK